VTIRDIISRHDISAVQISPGQIFTIGSVLAAHGREANFLVFGCGNDSLLWYDLNGLGNTLFLEDHPGWRSKVEKRFPQLDIESVSYDGRTVADSLPIDEAELKKYPLPEPLVDRTWDVILVDSPMGHKPDKPGRSLSIYWASLIAKPETHVFVDDYNRKLERTYADHFIRSQRTYNVEVPRVLRMGEPSGGKMLWSMGIE
jgi:hypothetical protein